MPKSQEIAEKWMALVADTCTQEKNMSIEARALYYRAKTRYDNPTLMQVEVQACIDAMNEYEMSKND